MKITGKHLLIGGGMAILAGGAVYLSRLSRLKANLETVTAMMIHKINLSGITLRIDVTMKNPTQGTIQVKFPFIRLQYKGSTFATSQVQDKDFDIGQFSQVTLDPMYITLGFMSLASKAPALLKDYRATGSLSFDLDIVTTLNGNIPFSKINAIKL